MNTALLVRIFKGGKKLVYNRSLQTCPTIATILLVLALSVGCTACSAGGTPAPGSTPGAELDSSAKEILIYANLNPSDQARDEIENFNKTHDTVQIEVRDYSGEEGRKRLMVEIAAGRIPDILDMRGSEGWMPYRQLATAGYLENLWTYIENDPELGREGILEAPLKAAEVDGGLYMAFDSVVIYTLIGAKQVVGDRISWSLADLQEAFSTMPEDASITEYGYDKDSMFHYVISGCLDSCIDWETCECFFNNANFRSVLEFLNLFPLETEPMSGDIVKDTNERTWHLMSGRQMLINIYIQNLGAINLNEFFLGGPVSFVGYPVEDGSVGSYFGIRGAPLAISSQCPNKEAAWEFVSRKFKTASIDLSSEGVPEGIPINRKLFNKANQVILEKPPLAAASLDGSLVELRPLTKEDVQQYEAFINSVDRIALYDSALYDIIEEAAGPYFAGDKTLDETVELIQRRAQLYVNENR